MDIHKASSSIYSFSFGWKYDVFLNFRGEDIRTSFVDHLYHGLNIKGIKAFKDDRELNKGQATASGLFKAIEESRFAIIIFSKSYASSTWCLDEVVKIVECKSISEELVFPIFYKIDPSDVKKQSGKFQEAFDKYEDEYKENIEKVNEWRTALRKVGKLIGWHLKKDRYEVEFIEEIIKEISKRLTSTTIKTFDDLVGMDSRVQELKLLLHLGCSDVRIIGICGMGGLGKTTIARSIYELISYEFEESSFLANVRQTSEESGLIILQKQLLSQLLKLEDCNIWNVYDDINIIRSRLRHKRVLIVIDDVANTDQLFSLVGNEDWFGLGSRIIITSRDEHLLRSHGVNEVYKPKQLNDDEALQLFCIKAFKTNKPSTEYLQLSERVIRYASGLPLAINILGSFFFGRMIDQWESALERLKKEPERGIMDKLQISFDGLNEIDKKIFLDIACFFKGKDIDYVRKILDGCGFDSVWGINVLIERSLITIIDQNKLWMHDLLQVMGQEFVKRQCLEEPGKRSRLWKIEDVCHVLTENTGSEVVEGIILEPSEVEMHLVASAKVQEHLNANAKAFSKITNLRLLKLYNVQPPECMGYLSNKLRLLEWHGYSSKSLPSSLQLDKIVELSLPYSRIEQLWKETKILRNLKLIRLDHSNNFIRTPDFTRFPNLEKVNFEGCTRLREIHPSLLSHKKLMVLNLKGCSSLAILPNKIGMESLRRLDLSGCSKLKKFPEIVGNMECLSELFLDETAIKELPLSFKLLTGLALLSLKGCINLMIFPSAIKGLKSLKSLSLSDCFKLENVPKNLAQIESLEELDISGTAIRQPRPSIFLKKDLKALSLHGCRGSPSSTSLSLSSPISLMGRRSPSSMALKLPSLSGLQFFKKLDLSNCILDDGSILKDICSLGSLEVLNLSDNNFASLPESFNRLYNLMYINLAGCKRLRSLPTFPSNVKFVRVGGCASLEGISIASNLDGILGINHWKMLGQARSMFSMLSQRVLEILRVGNIISESKIPDWFNYQNEGSSVTITNPAYSFKKCKLAGCAISFVFHVEEHQPTIGRSQQLGPYGVQVSSYGDDQIITLVEDWIGVFEGQLYVSDHLVLKYMPCGEDFGRKQYPQKYKDIKFSFESDSPELKVKRCGVHPVFVLEEEELDQTIRPAMDELHGCLCQALLC